MLSGPLFRYPFFRLAGRGFKIALASALILLSSTGYAQQAANNHVAIRKAKSAPEAAPVFAEAQELLSQGHLDEAKQKIQELLKADPTSVEGYNLLGIVFSNGKNFPDALDAFQHALQLNPKSVKTHGNLANFYIAEGKPDLAEKEFKTALALAPADRDTNYNYGLFLLAKGSPSLAVLHFLRVHPPTVESRFHLVRAYLELGKTA
jgi:Tfp pilus assembly protein PilF